MDYRDIASPDRVILRNECFSYGILSVGRDVSGHNQVRDFSCRALSISSVRITGILWESYWLEAACYGLKAQPLVLDFLLRSLICYLFIRYHLSVSNASNLRKAAIPR